MKRKLLLIAPALLGLLLGGCDSNDQSSQIPSVSSSLSSDDSSESAIPKKDFVGITYESETLAYDGSVHMLGEVKGAPEGTKITYIGRNQYKDVGNYPSSVTLSKEGYNDKTLNAVLIINPASFSGLTYESKTVTYDGKDHINDIQLVGVLPEDSNKETKITNENGKIVTSAIEVGNYSYKVTISNKNFITATFEAKLSIKAEKKNMPVFVSNNGNVYFANGLHNGFAYSYNSDWGCGQKTGLFFNMISRAPFSYQPCL